MGVLKKAPVYATIQGMHGYSKTAAAFLFMVLCGLPLSAEAGRSVPADLFLIIDGSAALEQGRDEAFIWLCGKVVDGRLQEGDRLTIWVAGEKAEKIYSGTVAGNETKEEIKALIRSIPLTAGKADYPGALREAVKQNGAGDPGRLACALLISGMTAGYNSLSGREIQGLLRYSRFEEFSAWRAVTVALGIEAGVKSAAAAFMR
jgi:hypothetical protein